MVVSKSIQGGPVTVSSFKLSRSYPSLVVGTVDPAFLSQSSNGEHNWRAKNYGSGVLPPINFSASHYSFAVQTQRIWTIDLL